MELERLSPVMTTPMPDEVDLLMVKSKSALMRFPVAHLRAFCEAHDFMVSPTGKTGLIKQDYATAIWSHVSVSVNIELQYTAIDKILHRITDH